MTDPDRTQELADREEIRQIFVSYARYLDSGDHAGYASLFAENGVLKAALGEAVGPAAIQAVLDGALTSEKRASLPKAIHVMNNQSIDIDGDTATTQLIWFYLTTDGDGVPTVLQAGQYVDDLVREDGVWKIARHDITRLLGRGPFDAAPTTRHDTLEQRVQRLEDQDAIWRLFMTYKKYLDGRDFKGYASLFTEDALWTGNLGKVIGPAQIEDMLVKTMEVWEHDRDRTHHIVVNPVIDVDGDTATASCNWGYVTRNETDAPVFLMLGTYYDELRRTPDGWRFSKRTAYSDIPYLDLTDVKAHPAPYVDPQYIL